MLESILVMKKKMNLTMKPMTEKRLYLLCLPFPRQKMFKVTNAILDLFSIGVRRFRWKRVGRDNIGCHFSWRYVCEVTI